MFLLAGTGCLLLLLATAPESNVLDLVAYAWAGFDAGFWPSILMTLYWKSASRLGILLGIISSGITVIAWKQISGGIFDLYEIVPGFVLLILVIVVFSMIENSRGK